IFTEIASECLPDTGAQGGASSRHYKNDAVLFGAEALLPVSYAYGWTDLSPSRTVHPKLLPLIASDYVPPLPVTRIARDKRTMESNSPGYITVDSRKPGKLAKPSEMYCKRERVHYLDALSPIFRRSVVGQNFVL